MAPNLPRWGWPSIRETVGASERKEDGERGQSALGSESWHIPGTTGYGSRHRGTTRCVIRGCDRRNAGCPVLARDSGGGCVVPVPITTASAHRHALLLMNPEMSPERGRHRDGPAVDGAPKAFRPDPCAGSGDLGDHREASAGRGSCGSRTPDSRPPSPAPPPAIRLGGRFRGGQSLRRHPGAEGS